MAETQTEVPVKRLESLSDLERLKVGDVVSLIIPGERQDKKVVLTEKSDIGYFFSYRESRIEIDNMIIHPREVKFQGGGVVASTAIAKGYSGVYLHYDRDDKLLKEAGL